MNFRLRADEWIMLAAGLLLAVSLPLLADGSFEVWLAAQVIYFVGVVVMIMRYFFRGHA